MSKPHLTLVPDLTPEPVDPRVLAIVASVPGLAGMRLFTALQGLSMPKGMLLTRGATRSFCANIVTEMTGLPASGRQKARPPRGLGLEEMLAWLIADAESKGLVIEIQSVG